MSNKDKFVRISIIVIVMAAFLFFGTGLIQTFISVFYPGFLH